MNRIVVLLLFCLSMVNAQPKTTDKTLLKLIDNRLAFAVKQQKAMAVSLLNRPGKFPRTLDNEGKLRVCDTTWWTCGFFPGTLWYLYEYAKDEQVKKYAQQFSARLEGVQYATNTHDIGFVVYCSFGNGYRLTGTPEYKTKIETAARSLATRFNPAVGCIKSWDFWPGFYPVIIDNMMNLELLFEASKLTGDPKYKEIAVAHADTTLKNHFRSDASCFHVVNYHSQTGAIVQKRTRQGYADASAWARGQAWALYGYTLCYRETKNPVYLQQAQKIAAFILHHPRLPKDKIPYWDFDDPKIPDTYRDVSAGAVICSALIELSRYVFPKESREYLSVAKTQLLALSSPHYLAKYGTNGNFLLLHSVGSLPDNSEVDVPLSYADYYYVEALLRYRKLLQTP
jgi:unsaturated chondroitin disaccharide hydrolase